VEAPSEPVPFDLDWAVRIPMRDGVKLSAVAYRPRETKPTPCLFNLTPYSVQRMHERGTFFAGQGYTFLIVDSRGRGNSEGRFRPFLQEALDGHDIVKWIGEQPWCNGKVAMWGGSYQGYDQWATLKESPPHLGTIVPTASVYPGLDFPMRGNVSYPYAARWLSFVSARAVQDRVFADVPLWTRLYREQFEAGRVFSSLSQLAGDNGETFREWTAHPMQDEYWDAYVPTQAQYASIDIPILTITGSHDGDQLGALTYYRNHMRWGSPRAKAQHYLVIGPWNHAGTCIPEAKFGGLTVGAASLLDMNRLHLDWYNWTLAGDVRPEFLKDRVAYYVLGADSWRYASTLEAVTQRVEAYYLSSDSAANDVFSSGFLSPARQGTAQCASYVYDPRDVSRAPFESADPDSLIDQSAVLAGTGKQLVYHSRPFDQPTEISGSFQLTAWISLDQPDTDFTVSLFEITEDGRSFLLTFDLKRARYRESLRKAELIRTEAPLCYHFDTFNFVSRRIERGSRLRLVIAPINTISRQKNFNSGGLIADESMADARPVKVTLFHDPDHPSALYVPFGAPLCT
jgi:uncharacterized protein